MSNELFNKEEEFLALLEEEAAELAAQADEEVLETVSSSDRSPPDTTRARGSPVASPSSAVR